MNRIEINPEICFGKPHIKGTRLKVSFILELLGSNWTVKSIIEEYEHITEQDILACLSYASNVIEDIKQPTEAIDAI